MAAAATDGCLRGMSVVTVSSVCAPYWLCGQTLILVVLVLVFLRAEVTHSSTACDPQK